MAIKVYGDKIVFPDNTEQTTAGGGTPTDVYTKEQIDAQQEAQDVKIDKNTSDLTNVYTKTEVDDSQSAQDTEIAKKIDDAPEDGETYARNNKTWVSISDSSGIPDAPVDGAMYGRKDGEWDTVADAGDVYTKEQTDDLLDEKADKDTTYTKTEVDGSQDAQDVLIKANTDAIAALPTPVDAYTKAESDAIDNAQDVKIDANTDAIAALPTPVDTYTKTEIDNQQNAQDVEIAKKANTDDTYTKTQTNTLLDSKANVGDSYTKAETYNNTEIDSKLFEKADKTTTYTKTEVDDSQATQDVNISGNTAAIGTLSGRVSANEQDIATLQDGIFFSSSYTAEYPDNPNRDPGTGNMYMQNISDFTYSYADTNQVFLSKTDEQGNVRQFTAVKPDDTIVLNQVNSPNYGRYKVNAVNDLGDHVNLIVEFQIGEGTLLEGDTVALQAFPTSESDSIWTEEGGVAVYDGAVNLGNKELPQKLNIYEIGSSKYGFGGVPYYARMYFPDDGNLQFGTMSKDGNDTFTSLMELGNDGSLTTTQNMTVNGMNIGCSPAQKNTWIGKNALSSVTNGMFVVAVGEDALKSATNAYNTALGYNAGGNLTTGSGNTLIGYQAQASSPDVTNEVTIGGDDVTKTRLKGQVIVGAVSDSSTSIETSAQPPNVYVDGKGQLYKSTSAFYSAEEVDKKLAIKDKLIEKLSARLDELEKKVK